MKINEMLTIQKSPTLEDLRKGCEKAKPKAQRELYNKLAPKMLGVCLRYIKDKAEAEHVMVGGFVKVFEKIKQFSGEGSFEGWIRRIIVNEALMYIRKNQSMTLAVEVEEVDFQLDYGAFESSLIAEDLIDLIQDLPIGYKTVFNLYAIEGYNHAEIAEKLDITESTSKSQLSRARKMLQNKLYELETAELKNIRNHGSGE